jgi:hypothetical protein
MSEDKGKRSTRFAEAPRSVHRYPYSGARYGAYDSEHVLVEQNGDWGVFTRNAEWIEGPLRMADPIFARWVTSKFIMDAVLEKKGRLEDWS